MFREALDLPRAHKSGRLEHVLTPIEAHSQGEIIEPY